jgi:hypothetical protein
MASAPAPDLVPRVCQGLHNSLGLSHGKESVRTAPIGLVVLHEGDRNHVSNGGFSSIYRHELPHVGREIAVGRGGPMNGERPR